MGNETITLIIDAKNLASKQVKELQRDLKGVKGDVSKADAAMNRMGMVAKGALVAGFAAAGYAAVQFVGDSLAAFREEEVGIAKLGASLQANVENWDGNTDAIEQQIGAMVRSTGFSDGAMRESLTRLVGATKDVDKAFRLQAVAMDLARFKGISLEDASTALIKVEGGQYRALKELGIVLEKGASQTEALAAVQKVAGGQMAAYAETTAGKTEILNNRLEDMQEEIGSRLTPALTTATERMLGFMDAMDPDAPISLPDKLGEIERTLNTLNPMMWGYNILAGDTAAAQAALAESAGEAAGETARSWDTGSERIGAALGQVQDDSGDTRRQIVSDVRREINVFEGMTEYLLGEYNTDFGRAMDITEARLDRNTAKTDEEFVEASARLAELGALTQTGYDAWLAALERLAASTKGKVHQAYLDAIADVRALREVANRPINVRVNYRPSGSPTNPVGHYASGGPVQAGVPIVVGERRAEVFVPDTSGYIRPAASSSGGSGGGGVTLVVNSAYPPTRGQIAEWADVLDAEFNRRRPAYSPYGR